MGHRALVAYERPDELYNLHYTHWGGLNLRLKHELSPETPFGEEESHRVNREAFAGFLETTHSSIVSLDGVDKTSASVDIEPLETQCSLDEILTEHLDYETHEALYVVSLDFDVQAFRTFPLGFHDVSETVEMSPRRGHGVVGTIRWYNETPVGDGYVRGWFAGARELTGVMIDQEMFSERQATSFLMERLLSNLRNQRVHVRRADTSKPR